MIQDNPGISADLFRMLTPKQRETIELLADGWTSKEIASQLDISESAAVQRIETLRTKAGGVLRKDLARLYREFSEHQSAACKEITGKKFHLSEYLDGADVPTGSQPDQELFLSDAVPFERPAPWAMLDEPKVVPEVLDGENFLVSRLMAALLLAIGMVVLMLVLLAVSGELVELI